MAKKKKTKTPTMPSLGELARGALGGLRRAHAGGSFSKEEVIERARARVDVAVAENDHVLLELAEARAERASQMREVIERRSKRVQAYATRLRKTVRPVKGAVVIAGCVQDKTTDLGLSGLTVIATGAGGQVLGTSGTDALGYFRFQWQPAELPDGDELDIVLSVTDADANAIGESRHTFSSAPGTTEFVCLSVDGDDVESNVETARRVRAAVDAEVDRLRRRAHLLVENAADDPLLRGSPRASGALKVKRAPAPPTLESVTGVGDSFAATLRQAGVKDAQELAGMKSKELAKVLDVPQTRSKAILAAARERIKQDKKK